MKQITLPRQWQDWVSWALGLTLLLTPWIFGYWVEPKALTNALICGGLLVALEVLTLTTQRLWEEVLNVTVGSWLVVSGLVLHLTSSTAAIVFLIVGFVVIGLSFWEIREIRGRSAS